MHYFGAWDDSQAELDKYLAEKDYWYTGTLPPTEVRTLADLLNEYLGKKKDALDLGELTESRWREIVRFSPDR